MMGVSVFMLCVPLPGMSLSIELKKLFKGPQNHPDICTGLLARSPRGVKDPNFHPGKTVFLHPDQHFRTDHRPRRLQVDLSEDLLVKKFKRTVDVSDFETEHQPDQLIPSPSIGLSDQIVLSIEAIADDRIVVRNMGDKQGKL